MKKKRETRHLSLRIDPETLEKFHYICDYEGRSANAQLLVYIRETIRRFDAEHGPIQPENRD